MGTAAATSLLVGLKAQADPAQDVAVPAGQPADPAAAAAPAGAGGGGKAAPSASGAAGTRTPASGGGVTGTFDGRRVSTPYGLVSVSVTMSAGRITDVKAVLPTAGQSQQVSGNAGPKLRQQVLAKQNATIDAVSGATYTSEGYRQSLQSALDKVKRG